MSIKAFTVNELIVKLGVLRDIGVFNGSGQRMIDGNSSVFAVNNSLDDAHWITPVQVIDYDCFHPEGPWIVEFRVRADYSLEDSDNLSNWLDGE